MAATITPSVGCAMDLLQHMKRGREPWPLTVSSSAFVRDYEGNSPSLYRIGRATLTDALVLNSPRYTKL